MRIQGFRLPAIVKLSVGSMLMASTFFHAGLAPAANGPGPNNQGISNPSTVPSLAAVIAAMPKNLPRAKGPGLQVAIDAAKAAQQACLAKGAKVSVLIADSAGQPVVLLSGDGAGFRSQLIARTKANVVAKFKLPSGEVEKKAKTDPALAQAAAADPDIGVLRGGAFPVTQNGEMVAIVAVSGGSLVSGDLGLDGVCAKVGVERLQMQ